MAPLLPSFTPVAHIVACHLILFQAVVCIKFYAPHVLHNFSRQRMLCSNLHYSESRCTSSKLWEIDSVQLPSEFLIWDWHLCKELKLICRMTCYKCIKDWFTKKLHLKIKCTLTLLWVIFCEALTTVSFSKGLFIYRKSPVFSYS